MLLEQDVKPKMHGEQGRKNAAAETRSVGFDSAGKHQYRRRPAAALAHAEDSGGAVPTFAWWQGRKGGVSRDVVGTRDASPGQSGYSHAAAPAAEEPFRSFPLQCC